MAVLLRRFSSETKRQLKTQCGRMLGKTKGLLFPTFTKERVEHSRHPLDKANEEYLKVLRSVVFPACQQVAPNHFQLHQRIGQVLEHNVPAFDTLWTYHIEYMYKHLVPEEEQTEESLTKMRILRGTVEINYSATAILDDITDKSEKRANRPAWFTVCTGGTSLAFYDGILVGYLPFHLLREFFRHSPAYPDMLEALAKGNMSFILGQQVELMCSHDLDSVDYTTVAMLKTGQIAAAGAKLITLHLGITDKITLQKVEEIFFEIGKMYQLLDDFRDVYEEPEESDEQSMVDVRNSSVTWVRHVAKAHLNEKEREILQECSRGGNFAQNFEITKQIMDAINLPKLYHKEIQKRRQKCSVLIKQLPHEQLRTACKGLLKWMLADE